MVTSNGRRDERRGVRDDRAELNALRHRLDNALDVTAEEELVDVLQRHRQADRHDHLLHDAHALVPQRCPDELVLHPSGERADRHREDGREHDRHMQHLRAHIGHETAERHLLAMGEGAQAGGAVHEVHAHRHQAEHEAEDATRVELLPEARPEAGALAVIAGLRGIRRSLLPAFGGVGIAAFRFRRTACRGFVEAHDGTLLGERLLGDLHRRAAFAELVLLGDRLVDAHGVLAVRIHFEGPGTVLRSGGRGLLLAAQRDRHVGDRRLVLGLQNAAHTAVLRVRHALVHRLRGHGVRHADHAGEHRQQQARDARTHDGQTLSAPPAFGTALWL